MLSSLSTPQLAALAEATSALGYLVLAAHNKPRTFSRPIRAYSAAWAAVTAWALWTDAHTVMLVLACCSLLSLLVMLLLLLILMVATFLRHART